MCLLIIFYFSNDNPVLMNCKGNYYFCTSKEFIEFVVFQNDFLLNGVQDCRNDQDHQKRLGEMFRILEQLTMLIFY